MTKKPVTVMLDPENIEQLEDYKERKGVPKSLQIRQFVKEGLELRKRREKWNKQRR